MALPMALSEVLCPILLAFVCAAAFQQEKEYFLDIAGDGFAVASSGKEAQP